MAIEKYNLDGEIVLLPGSSNIENPFRAFFDPKIDQTLEEVGYESRTELENLAFEGLPIPSSGFSLSFVRCGLEEMSAQVTYIKTRSRDISPTKATMIYLQDGDTLPDAYRHLPVITQSEFVERYTAGRQAYADALKVFRRPAYIPEIIQASEGLFQKDSRYFGRPWMPNSMKWPGGLDKPMNFVLQLNIETLPEEWKAKLGSRGLLLFFHSDEYNTMEIGKNQNSNAVMSHVVIVDIGEPGGLREFPLGLDIANSALVITSWQTVSDHPWVAEENLPGLQELEAFSEVDTNLFDENLLIENPNLAVSAFHIWSCDKLGGWPKWEQGNETMVDRNGQPMMFIYQVSGDGLLDKFPDVDFPVYGQGHIFYSPDTGELYHQWACD